MTIYFSSFFLWKHPSSLCHLDRSGAQRRDLRFSTKPELERKLLLDQFGPVSCPGRKDRVIEVETRVVQHRIEAARAFSTQHDVRALFHSEHVSKSFPTHNRLHHLDSSSRTVDRHGCVACKRHSRLIIDRGWGNHVHLHLRSCSITLGN